MEQTLPRPPKAARANWFIDWALAYNSGAGLLRKSNTSGAVIIPRAKKKS